jgi:hypothetical protein
MVAAAVMEAFDLAATVLVNPLQLARAEQPLRSGIQFELKGASMSDHDIKHCRLAVYCKNAGVLVMMGS